jgi:hypothetical protein
MEARNRIAQVYGYAVCLVVVIVFIINLAGLISAFFDLSDPMHAGSAYRDKPSLASFENYRIDIVASLTEGQPMPDDATLQAMFEAAKNDRIQSVRLSAKRNITLDSILIVLCVILFATHALWLRRLSTGRSEQVT